MKNCKQYIKDNFDSFKHDLKGLIEIPSVTTDRKKSVEALNYVIDLARRYGLNAYTVADGRVGIVEYGEGDETLGVLAHVDVVDVEVSEWRFPPFALTEHDGFLYGRGVADDKGAVMMILYALKFLSETGVRGNKKIQFVIGTQEESSWEDIDAYKEEMYPPDYGFTPDGEFPISNAEKGYIDLALTFPAGSITAISGGNAHNTIPSLVKVTAAGKEYMFTGKAAHSSIPWEGENAIVKAAKELYRIVPDGVFHYLAETFDAADYLGSENESTIAPTLIEMAGERIILSINVRTGYTVTNADIIASFEKAGAEYGFGLTAHPYAMEPIYVDEKSSFLTLMKKVYDDIIGTDSPFVPACGTSYAKALPNFVSFGPLFPGEPDSVHQADENLAVDKIILACEIYTEYLLAAITGGKK